MYVFNELIMQCDNDFTNYKVITVSLMGRKFQLPKLQRCNSQGKSANKNIFSKPIKYINLDYISISVYHFVPRLFVCPTM